MSDQNLTPEMRREILAQYYESGKALPLDMSLYRLDTEECGTTVCIAGFAVFLFDKDLWNSYDKFNFAKHGKWVDDAVSTAAKLLGLSSPADDRNNLDHLFHRFDIATPQQAAAALRALNVKADANV